MVKYKVLSGLIFGYFIILTANAQQIFTYGGKGIVGASDIVFDPEGNYYVAGNFDSMTLGNETLISPGGSNIYLAKFDSKGKVLWLRQAGKTGSALEYDIDVDADGNIYMTGIFTGSITFEYETLKSSSLNAGFAVKYSPEGIDLWARKIDGGMTFPLTISPDNSGNAYLGGMFRGQARIGDSVIASNKEYDAFFVKYDIAGDPVWITHFGSAGTDAVSGIGITHEGNILTAEYGCWECLTGDTVSSGQGALFVSSYTPDGKMLWAKKIATGFIYPISSLVLDKKNNIYLAGTYNFVADFSTTHLEGDDAQEIFTAKLSPEGELLWVMDPGTAGSDARLGITSDKAGNCYVTGLFDKELRAGDKHINSYGGADAFAMKISASGSPVWLEQLGGPGDDGGAGIAIDGNGNCYVGGSFSGTAKWNTTQVASAGKTDAFIITLSAVTGYKTDKTLIFPNPAHHKTTVVLPDSFGSAHYSLIDARGRQVQSGELVENEFNDIALTCANGLYILIITAGKQSLVQKIVVE